MPSRSLPQNWRRFQERYNLIGNKCETCGKSFFPARLICPECRSKGKMVVEEMPRTGTILSWTKVFVAPAGFEVEAPYFMALIEFENGTKILSQIVDVEDKQVKFGAKVKKVFRKIADPSATSIISYGYKFTIDE